jgi:hypothetical protein
MFRIFSLVALALVVAAATATSASAQEALSRPRPSSSMIAPGASEIEETASTRDPSGVLPLATDGPATLPPLSATGSGCCLSPMFQCYGPDYRGCTPRIYYGTNPNDDDFVRDLDSCPPHAWWYQKAFRMVVRKKRCAEVLDH